ncbi:MAG: hypothetical protein F2677_03310 [Actinobacteria bacterium]|uniref:Unannotated protein n=1 Tax=freshwater metagenome TaxID=449393 RepID=A0A6J6PXV7_9ZZZZ|nr:hypothetical protein [Actinomycetota bacterium]
MDKNTKPQAINLGQVLDDESINRNVIAINALSPKSQYMFGKSSPMITDYDIAEHDLLPDADFCNSMSEAESHLRALGLIPCWNRADQVRFHRHMWMHKSWTEYAGAR